MDRPVTAVAAPVALAPHLTPVLGRYFQREWSHGQGHRLYDTDGRAYLDFANGIAVTALGHVHPRVTAAIHAQVDKLIGPINAVGFTEPISRLADDIAATFPGSLDSVMFLNSGSEAIDGALKLARRVTGRPGIVAFRGGFHGRTLGRDLGDELRDQLPDRYEPLLPGVHLSTFPAVYRGFGGDEAAAVAGAMADLRTLTSTDIPASSVACVLIEPVQGEGGFTPAPPAFLRELRAFCDEHGILLIADEVQSGYGRTGRCGLRARWDRAGCRRAGQGDRQRPAALGDRVVPRAPGALGPRRTRVDLRREPRGLCGRVGRPRRLSARRAWSRTPSRAAPSSAPVSNESPRRTTGSGTFEARA